MTEDYLFRGNESLYSIQNILVHGKNNLLSYFCIHVVGTYKFGNDITFQEIFINVLDDRSQLSPTSISEKFVDKSQVMESLVTRILKKLFFLHGFDISEFTSMSMPLDAALTTLSRCPCTLFKSSEIFLMTFLDFSEISMVTLERRFSGSCVRTWSFFRRIMATSFVRRNNSFKFEFPL